MLITNKIETLTKQKQDIIDSIDEYDTDYNPATAIALDELDDKIRKIRADE